MGTLKIKDVVVYEGPIGECQLVHNWNDSMATYYPYVNVLYVEVDQLITKRIDHQDINDLIYSQNTHLLEINADEIQKHLVADIKNKQLKEIQKTFIKPGDRVIIYKGKKFPVGTEGVVSFVGRGYGVYVHMELDNGQRYHYVNVNNVKKIDIDELIESILLE